MTHSLFWLQYCAFVMNFPCLAPVLCICHELCVMSWSVFFCAVCCFLFWLTDMYCSWVTHSVFCWFCLISVCCELYVVFYFDWLICIVCEWHIQCSVDSAWSMCVVSCTLCSVDSAWSVLAMSCMLYLVLIVLIHICLGLHVMLCIDCTWCVYEGESNENLKYFLKYYLLCRSCTKLYHFKT